MAHAVRCVVYTFTAAENILKFHFFLRNIYFTLPHYVIGVHAYVGARRLRAEDRLAPPFRNSPCNGVLRKFDRKIRRSDLIHRVCIVTRVSGITCFSREPKRIRAAI